jgi:citronellol/citronellal dehydrogenase
MRYRSVFRPDLLSEQTIVITGGGSGIGRCIAHEAASLGAHVVLVGRKPEKLAAAVGEITSDGGKADFAQCDVRDEAAVVAVVTALLSRHGRIHGLVNNAGGQFQTSLEDLSLKGFETVLRTNLLGGFLFAREVFARSMRTHGGAIVNLAADVSRGTPSMAHSGAARAGMIHLTQTAAVEWAPSGVRVNAVAPGYIATQALARYGTTALEQTLAPLIPLGRLGAEAEVSAAVCFLLGEGAAYISGTTLNIDGAASSAHPLFPSSQHGRSPVFDGFQRSHRRGKKEE